MKKHKCRNAWNCSGHIQYIQYVGQISSIPSPSLSRPSTLPVRYHLLIRQTASSLVSHHHSLTIPHTFSCTNLYLLSIPSISSHFSPPFFFFFPPVAFFPFFSLSLTALLSVCPLLHPSLLPLKVTEHNVKSPPPTIGFMVQVRVARTAHYDTTSNREDMGCTDRRTGHGTSNNGDRRSILVWNVTGYTHSQPTLIQRKKLERHAINK